MIQYPFRMVVQNKRSNVNAKRNKETLDIIYRVQGIFSSNLNDIFHINL